MVVIIRDRVYTPSTKASLALVSRRSVREQILSGQLPEAHHLLIQFSLQKGTGCELRVGYDGNGNHKTLVATSSF